jgi:hypothetical protein
VATDSLDLVAVSGPGFRGGRSQGRRTVAIMYPLGHTMLYVYEEKTREENSMLKGEFHDQGDCKWIVIRG